MITAEADAPPISFTAKALENSAPFDFEKRLRGEAGLALLANVLTYLDEKEAYSGTRQRKRKPKDEEVRRRTLDSLLANLLSLWLNRVDTTRFLAVPFGQDDYAHTGLSLKEMQRFRDALQQGGYIAVAPGFRKVDAVELGKPFGRRTRMRATDQMIEWFEEAGVHWPSIRRIAERGVIHIRKAVKDVDPEPNDVTNSRPVIERINARLEAASIELPADAWARVRRKAEPDESDDKDSYRAYAGDDTAKVLRRIFSHTWDRGGRIYGGWWMHLPKAERRHLTIDGEGTVELDYAQLHPTLLFVRVGPIPDMDPYAVPEIEGDQIRDLGKRTFQRLLNNTSTRSGAGISLRAGAGDNALLPPGLKFSAYLSRFKNRLAPISQWFGTGEGMSLQREDSDLAIRILDHMDQAGVLTLPIHDSFIVQRRHESLLRKAMEHAFEQRYGVTPPIKGSE